jgi:hypothetical protein
VSLYKNGVGFFEHSGHVTGSQSVTIDFTTAQLNDVLQSLTAIDLDGGRIVGAGYNSTTPLEQQLKALPLALGEDPTAIDFYNAIRGARVEVHSGAVTATGRMLKIEVLDSGAQEIRLITVVSDSGEVKSLSLTPTTSVQLLDTDLHKDVTRYLQLLAGSRNQGLRHLTLQDNAPSGGGGSRELRVSYISEVPVWKSTYRILFTDSKTSGPQPVTLQGWSVVDNTTGEDWLNVHLSLIAGAPQSFIQPLSQPIYSRRPEIAIAEEAQLTPQTHESGEMAYGAARPVSGSGIHGTIVDASGAVISNATVTATNTDTGTQTKRTTDAQGNFMISPLPPGPYNVEVVARGFQRLLQENVAVNGVQMAGLNLKLSVGAANETITVTAAPPMLETSEASVGSMTDSFQVKRNSVANANQATLNYATVAAASIAPNATGTAFDDNFAYRLAEPITIRKNESALVPILQTKVDAERVTLWSPGTGTPLRALWMTNTSDLTLDRGSFSIIENGEFGGEGLLDPIHPKERRLLSYAVDQAVRVTTEGETSANRVVAVSATKGMLVLRSSRRAEVTYAVHNAAPEARTVVIEHPVRAGYVLGPDEKPAETTPAAYRFRVAATGGETARLHVSETAPGEARFDLSSQSDEEFAAILSETGHNATVEAALQPVIAAQRKESDAEDAVKKIEARLQALRTDEDRQRSNVTALASADKASRDRFVHDLNTTEDKIAAAQKDLETAEEAAQSAQDDLDKKIEAVQLDEKL